MDPDADPPSAGKNAIRGAHANKFRVVIIISPSDLDAAECSQSNTCGTQWIRMPIHPPLASQRSICVLDRVRAPIALRLYAQPSEDAVHIPFPMSTNATFC